MAVLLACLTLVIVPGYADTIGLGFISFDNLIPGAPGSPGVNDFSINNLTGDPAAGGYALPPDFPVLTDVVFQNSTLILSSAEGTSTVDLGDLGPGSYNPDALQFPDTTTFSSALFTAVIAPTMLELANGTTATVSISQLMALLVPGSGDSLTAGTDFVLLQASGEISSAPEPSYCWTVGAAAVVLASTSFTRRRRAARPAGR